VNKPHRGDVWWVDFDPTKGRETAKTRPALIVSSDGMNHGNSGLVIVMPITSTIRNMRSWVHIKPPAGGLRTPGSIKCEEVKSVSVERLGGYMGNVDSKVMAEVEYRLSTLLELD
jgi:mRNA interferase MazF